jgi:hypothetical protein
MCRVCVTIVAVEQAISIKYYECVAVFVPKLSSMHSACAVLYCHLWPVWFNDIFTHYFINGAIFEGKKSSNIKCVFWITLQFLSETFLILRRIQRDIIINCIDLHVKYPLFQSDFNETWIFATDFRKILDIKFHVHRSSGSRVVPCGQTDRHDEFNSHFS